MPRKCSTEEWRVSVTHSLSEIPDTEWDALGHNGYPFTQHCFLFGLEQHDCLEPFGWHPVYFQVHRESTLVAAIPCYLKTNSYGELVFDHAWVNAYHRSGLDYYPKLVAAIPYTPATGPRFLINREQVDATEVQQSLRELLCIAIQKFCDDNKLSSWHLLFADKPTLDSVAEHNLEQRSDVQFHWHNRGYRDFDHFLSQLNSRKRKNIRKERRDLDTGLEIGMQTGGELSASDWQRVYQLYASIYQRKYGTATLTPGFFVHLGETMSDQVLVACARKDGEIVAASLFFRSDTHLYGRVWGCDHYYHNLHFECCYYQGIEYCISQGIEIFDPGAQGEHKLARGFLPTLTWSGHWIAHPQFREAITQFLQQERSYIQRYLDELLTHSPFRRTEK